MSRYSLGYRRHLAHEPTPREHGQLPIAGGGQLELDTLAREAPPLLLESISVCRKGITSPSIVSSAKPDRSSSSAIRSILSGVVAGDGHAKDAAVLADSSPKRPKVQSAASGRFICRSRLTAVRHSVGSTALRHRAEVTSGCTSGEGPRGLDTDSRPLSVGDGIPDAIVVRSRPPCSTLRLWLGKRVVRRCRA